MAHHWPVIVGINQYQSLQPLLFAQFDAVELKDFLLNEAGLPPQHCSLLTDISPMVYQGAAFPTREVIVQRLQQRCEQAQPEDTVWFFFSGYGVQWQGQDYLLPIDGRPDKLEETAIPTTTIFNLLQNSPARQRLIILDINRSQSALPHQRLGVPTMELAKQTDIPLLLSCRPNQFSQETLAVRHGLFTEALLEGLRFHGCLTLSQLAAYLIDRVPELCQHHFRPEQNPVSVVPTQHQFLMLVPPQAAGQMATAAASETAPLDRAAMDTWPTADAATGMAVGATSTSTMVEEGRAPSKVITTGPSPSVSGTAPDGDMQANLEIAPETPREAGTANERTIRWLPWLLVAAGMLLLGVLLRNQSTFIGQRRSPEGQVPSLETSEAPDSGMASDTPPAESETSATPQNSAPAGEPLFPNADAALSPQTALDQARIALEQRRFGEALNWLNQIPEDQRPEEFAALQVQAQEGYDAAARSGEVVLNNARKIIEPISASRFNDAIEEARQVAVGDEFYDQAQADIARWSRIILDLAQGRAANGDFDDAIAAAALVPQDQGESYALAQSEIQKWQQQKVNRQLLQDAQARLQPDQATSFEEAIQLAQQIPPDTPEYDTAQQRINQWSQDILVIARARAAAGQLPGAIAAAELVPPGTSAYDQAQEEIGRWQGQE
jgi:uncharacterized caspase-like protein